MKSVIVQGIAAYERAKLRDDELSSVGFSIAMNNVKIVTSQSAADIVRHVMLINGIYGYRNDSPYSVARHMRDATIGSHHDQQRSHSLQHIGAASREQVRYKPGGLT